MSKNFKTQDYFRYKKLGKKWRKPRGRQSKLRKRKGGSGVWPNIGHGTPAGKKNMHQGLKLVNVSNVQQLEELTKDHGILISGSVGMKKTLDIYTHAKTKGLRVLNLRKIKKAEKRAEEIQNRKQKKETHTEKPHTEHKHEKKEKQEHHEKKEHKEEKGE